MTDDSLDDGTAMLRALPTVEPVSRLSLVIMSPGGTGNVALPERGTMTVGRALDCEIHIDDTKLSRRHAEIRCADDVHIVDLGSRNGTQVREERITANVPIPLRPGDSITIGASVLVLQRATAGIERPRHMWSHGYFEARLEEECATASPERPFAMLRLRVAWAAQVPPHGDPRVRAATHTTADHRPVEQETPPALVRWLRLTDIVGMYAPDEYEVLLTRTSLAEAEERVSQLRRDLVLAGARFALVLAAYPRDGRTPEALVGHATRALRASSSPGVEAPRELVAKGALERMEPIVARVAQGAINVLVLGETGVGKEVLARRIHALSPRAAAPLVSLNCAALSESLLESELFGHEKGAFTGALQAKPGLLESAEGGTVFLDEIGEMPLSVQAKLLRVIEQREVTRVGALRPRAIDVRFVSATHRDLEAEIARRQFRQDLYFRLNGIALTIPPLRERIDEIEPLSRVLIAQACRGTRRDPCPRLGPDALRALQRYGWPGNIRELRNVMERAVLLCAGEVITCAHLPMEKFEAVFAQPVGAVAPRIHPGEHSPEAHAPGRAADDVPAAADGDPERGRILEALEHCAGNQSQAARMLGMSRQTFIRRIEEYGLRRPRKRE